MFWHAHLDGGVGERAGDPGSDGHGGRSFERESTSVPLPKMLESE